VPGDAVAVEQRDEVARVVATKSGFRKMGVGRQKTRRRCLPVREVAAAAAGDEDLGTRFPAVFEQKNPPA
jgi:hypothetical protein